MLHESLTLRLYWNFQWKDLLNTVFLLNIATETSKYNGCWNTFNSRPHIDFLILIFSYTTGRFKTQTLKLSPTSCSSWKIKHETSCNDRKIGLHVSKLLRIKLNRLSALTLIEDLSNLRTWRKYGRPYTCTGVNWTITKRGNNWNNK